MFVHLFNHSFICLFIHSRKLYWASPIFQVFCKVLGWQNLVSRTSVPGGSFSPVEKGVVLKDRCLQHCKMYNKGTPSDVVYMECFVFVLKLNICWLELTLDMHLFPYKGHTTDLPLVNYDLSIISSIFFLVLMRYNFKTDDQD